MSIHKEGYKILTITIISLLVLNVIAKPFLQQIAGLQVIFGILSIVLFLLVLQFFRSPKRKINLNDNIVLCPADGKVVTIEEVFEPEYFKDNRLQISIFMSPLNVHINWAPISGVCKYMKYHPGKYLVAWHPKSSTENERTTLVIENQKMSVLQRQIAGAVARRIVYYPEVNQSISQGSEVGFIKFGSRIDLFLPIGTKPSVKIGDKVSGLKTVIAQV